MLLGHFSALHDITVTLQHVSTSQAWRPHFFVLSNNRLDWTAEQTDSEDKEDDEDQSEEEQSEDEEVKLTGHDIARFTIRKLTWDRPWLAPSRVILVF